MGSLISKDLKEGNATQVYDLGPAEVSTWGMNINNAYDGARWIWNTPNANAGASTNVIVKFSKTFKYAGPTKIGWYCISVDDIGYIDGNGYPIILNGSTNYNITDCGGGWWIKQGETFIGVNKNIQMLNGTNHINIYALNTGGPAGIIASIKTELGSIVRTDQTWTSKIVNSFQNAYILGPTNIAPWGPLNAGSFPSAQWIWSDPNGATNTTQNTYVKLSFVFTSTTQEGFCNIAVSDECYLYMNSERNATGTTMVTYPPINIIGLNNKFGNRNTINYVNGMNFIDIIVKNTKTQAGLIGSFFNAAGATQIVTSAQWTYSNIPIQSAIGNVYVIGNPPQSRLKSTIMPTCYPDIATQYIWSTQSDAAGTTGVNNSITFTYTFNYTGASSRGYCYIIIDGVCTLFINNNGGVDVKNGGLIWGDDQNTYNDFFLKPGNNTITIVAKNPSGTAGLAAIFYDNNDQIIAYTNKSWNYSATTTVPITKTFKDMNSIEGFTFKQFKSIENFSLFNPYKREGFDNMKIWNFRESSDWYKVVTNGFGIKMSETGITLPTRKYSIGFMYNLQGIIGGWNNIFHVTNSGRNWGTDADPNAVCQGCRMPAMWVIPNEVNFHIRFSTEADANDGADTVTSNMRPIGINETTFIVLTFDDNVYSIYFDGIQVFSKTFNNIRAIEPNAMLYIGDPWHNTNGTINIKGFTMYDGVLTPSQIYNIYENIEQGDPGPKGDKGEIGVPGEQGIQGIPGTPGTPGTNGINGTPGADGATGTPGTPGADGATGADGADGANGADGAPGSDGSDGQKGDPGIPGEKGLQGERGVPGSTNSKSALNYGAVIDTNINRIKTNYDTYAYCLGGTITCDDGNLNRINDDYKHGSTYSYKCSNETQAYCLNGVLESNARSYISPFPFSNSYKGFTVDTNDESPYVYDLGSNTVSYYSNNKYVASDDICNVLTNKNFESNCNNPNHNL